MGKVFGSEQFSVPWDPKLTEKVKFVDTVKTDAAGNVQVITKAYPINPTLANEPTRTEIYTRAQQKVKFLEHESGVTRVVPTLVQAPIPRPPVVHVPYVAPVHIPRSPSAPFRPGLEALYQRPKEGDTLMSVNLSQLLAGHYSGTDKNGLILEDSDTVEWRYDGFGHLSAHVRYRDIKVAPAAHKDQQ